MGESHHLIGADDVRSAGIAMRHAAEEMKSAANTIDVALDQHRNFLNDWLQRFEAAVDRMPQPLRHVGGPL
jgi:hypothetical protein